VGSAADLPIRRTAALRDPLTGAARCQTLGAWLRFAEKLYVKHRLALGQTATDAHDEALYLLLRTLDLPLDSDAAVLARRVTAVDHAALCTIFRRRVLDRTPAAYLTREAWLGGQRFYIDERALIPRSYFLEIIPQQLDQWLSDPAQVTRVADVGTGSGCLAILLAQHFPRARVDAFDVSANALEVAKINVRDHRLGRRVHLYTSDVLDAAPAAKYDVILSNPPYEPSAHVDALPVEFHREPRLALDGGADGLAIIRRLLRQARPHLKPHGLVLIEAGGLRAAMDREFAALAPSWLTTEDGADCICVFHAARL